MHSITTAAAAMPSGWLFGAGSVLTGGAIVPFLLSVLPDALALLVQRRRWQLLVGLVLATAAAMGSLKWTLSLAMAAPADYLIDWPQAVELLFGVGMVVALWHGLPRTMRGILRRRREDAERVGRSASPEVAPEPAPALDPLPV